MRITVEFESMEEFEAFRTSGKKTRTKKEEADENVAAQGNAPAPLAPPVGGQPGFNPGATAGFAPPAAGVAALGAFPAAGAPTATGRLHSLCRTTLSHAAKRVMTVPASRAFDVAA